MGWDEFWSDVGENLGNIFGGSAKARKNAENQLQNYRDAIKNYTGSEGYKNALNTASRETAKLAGQQANQAAAQQQSALRSSGQSGNAAAILAGNNASNTYQNAYNNNIQSQQQAAYNAGLAKIDAENQYNNARNENMSVNTNLSGNSFQTLLGVASILLSVLSDERAKDSVSTDDFFKRYKPRDLKKLSVSFGGK